MKNLNLEAMQAAQREMYGAVKAQVYMIDAELDDIERKKEATMDLYMADTSTFIKHQAAYDELSKIGFDLERRLAYLVNVAHNLRALVEDFKS